MFYQGVLIFYAAMSVIAFFLYGIDKNRAKQKRWRIKESVLLGVSFLGGATGALIGMKAFHHKTKHRYFWVVGVLGLIWQAVLAFYLQKNGL